MTTSIVPTSRVTVPDIVARKSGEKISALTAYDYLFAKLVDSAGIDMILVGDSVGSVVQGHSSTLPVTLDQIIYHAQCVVRGVSRALVVGDLPFMSYQVSPESGLEAAGRLIKEGGVAAVKLEGGVPFSATIRKIVDAEIPVVGHVGLTPQSMNRMGGFKVQGREKRRRGVDVGSRERVIEDALAVQESGAFAVVLEGIPAELASEITEELYIPTIGIGAGARCDGQILVMHDMLGIGPDAPPRFVKQYAALRHVITSAVSEYVKEVRGGDFPEEKHSYHAPRQVRRVLSVK